jgi:hypothetical protein
LPIGFRRRFIDSLSIHCFEIWGLQSICVVWWDSFSLCRWIETRRSIRVEIVCARMYRFRHHSYRLGISLSLFIDTDLMNLTKEHRQVDFESHISKQCMDKESLWNRDHVVHIVHIGEHYGRHLSVKCRSTFKLTSFSSFSTMNLLDCWRGDNCLSNKQAFNGEDPSLLQSFQASLIFMLTILNWSRHEYLVILKALQDRGVFAMIPIHILLRRSRNLNLEFSPDHDRTYPTMIKQTMLASPCLHWDPQLKTSYAVGAICCWRWECNLFQSESGYPLCFWNSSSTLSLWVHMMGFLTTKMRDI